MDGKERMYSRSSVNVAHSLIRVAWFALEGVKHLFGRIVEVGQVAPRAGAWIETRKDIRATSRSYVAPRAGAWIETSSGRPERAGPGRRAPRGRVD